MSEKKMKEKLIELNPVYIIKNIQKGLKKEVDEDIINLTDKEKDYRLSLSKRKDVEED